MADGSLGIFIVVCVCVFAFCAPVCAHDIYMYIESARARTEGDVLLTESKRDRESVCEREIEREREVY